MPAPSCSKLSYAGEFAQVSGQLILAHTEVAIGVDLALVGAIAAVGGDVTIVGAPVGNAAGAALIVAGYATTKDGIERIGLAIKRGREFHKQCVAPTQHALTVPTATGVTSR